MFFARLQKDLFKGMKSLEEAKQKQNDILSCLSHKVCRRLSSPVLSRKLVQYLRDEPNLMSILICSTK